jgi:type I restriction enzyme S subunit
MSYPVYSEMKASGVEWLGAVPGHWNIKRLKLCTHVVDEKLDAVPADAQYVGLENIESKTGRLLFNTEQKPGEGACLVFRAADVLFGKLRPYLAKVAVAEGAGVCTTEILPLRPLGINNRFLFYYLLSDSVIKIVDSSTYGVKMPRASWDFIGDLPQILPTHSEQQQIAAFLDRKTAELDSVIRLKERQLELLAEKRQAIISQAVTRGLDPNVPLKPSGVEWLGDVPEHWEIKRTRYVCHLNPSKSEVSTLPAETMVSFLPMDKVGIEGEIVLDENRAIEDVLQGFTYFRDGDNIVAKITPCFENGKGALVSKLTNNIGFGSTEFHVLRPMQHTVAGFIYYLTRTHLFRLLGTATMYGAGGQKRVPENFIRNFPIAFPPIHEQQAIVAYLDTETGRMEGVGAAIKTQIEKLREYRQALVSAAVTGKIDVRGEP